jgi:hypothetical protein
LLSIDSGRLIIYELKKKDDIDIAQCEVQIEDKIGISQNNKYMFSLSYQAKSLLGLKKQQKLTLGTDSE